MDAARTTPRQHAVSAIVPVYNVERYLAQCLGSIRSSLGRRLQLIIVDDGSTDGSARIARAFCERAEREHALPDAQLVEKENGGYGSAVNAGIERADGAYIGIVEPDDYLDGDLFGELFAIAEACDMPDIVKSTYKRVWMPDTPEQRIWGSLLRHRGVRTWREGVTDLGASPQLVRWHPSVWSAIYRRDFLDDARIRFIECPGAGWVDNPFVMRAMCQARTVAFTDEAWYCYREDRPGSSTVTKAPGLSLTRWLQMADEVAQSRFAADEGVLCALDGIAFRYLASVWDSPAWEDPDVRALADRVMERMEPGIVAKLDDVPPAAKARWLRESGKTGDAGSALRYRLSLLRELLWSWRENGLYFACERAGLHRHAPETGATPPNPLP